MDLVNHKGLERRWEPKWVPNPWILLSHCYALDGFMGASSIQVLRGLKKWLVLTGPSHKAVQSARKRTEGMAGYTNSSYPDNYLREMASHTWPHRVFAFIICTMKTFWKRNNTPGPKQDRDIAAQQPYSGYSNMRFQLNSKKVWTVWNTL